MLSKLYIGYADGLKVEKIVHRSKLKIRPKRDKIIFCFHEPFKYKVDKHPYLCVSIAKFGNIHMIMPAGIPCIPETTLKDIVVIDNTPVKVKEKPVEKKKWMFESSSSDGFYQVTENMGKLKCNCMGYFRSGDRRCKHIKEVEKEIGIVK
jgi:hypothetical protein